MLSRAVRIALAALAAPLLLAPPAAADPQPPPTLELREVCRGDGYALIQLRLFNFPSRMPFEGSSTTSGDGWSSSSEFTDALTGYDGTYSSDLVERDPAANTTTITVAGMTRTASIAADCSDGMTAEASATWPAFGPPPNPLPEIHELSISPAAFEVDARGGATIGVSVSEEVLMRFHVRRNPPRYVGGEAPARPRTFFRPLAAGSSDVRFDGVIRGRELPPGRYKLFARPRDWAGQVAPRIATAEFRVLR